MKRTKGEREGERAREMGRANLLRVPGQKHRAAGEYKGNVINRNQR